MNNIIKAVGLNKVYGDHHALTNVNFCIEKGSPVALVGPNGAGKTTLFSILCGYIKPTSGDISILGYPPGDKALFGKLAALPQDAQLDPRFSIAHQLKFYGQLQGFSAKKSIREVERTLELVGLADVLHVKPSELSHGMRKRVTIAQTLIGQPQIVLLDEASAGLDPLHAREVREVVANLSSDITFILSSHDLNELERLCSQVLYLDQGSLKEHQTLTTSENGHSRYFTLRMKQHEAGIIEALQQLDSVSDVVVSQDREYLISANTHHLETDLDILKLCHKNNWQYAQIFNGKTLENQLF
ncbi:MAG: ABC-2 type transport system ATP-binding protein [Alteromonadaceae bacterium]|jgi:ABC-2 type transport system ATP-binding protein